MVSVSGGCTGLRLAFVEPVSLSGDFEHNMDLTYNIYNRGQVFRPRIAIHAKPDDRFSPLVSV